MNDDYAPRAVAMRMRVFFGGATMCGPTRVANTIAAGNGFLAQCLFQVTQLAFRTPNLHFVVFVDDGNTG